MAEKAEVKNSCFYIHWWLDIYDSLFHIHFALISRISYAKWQIIKIYITHGVQQNNADATHSCNMVIFICDIYILYVSLGRFLYCSQSLQAFTVVILYIWTAVCALLFLH